MIIDNLKKIVSNLGKQTAGTIYLRNAIKEEIQNFILQYIYNSEIYKELIFTGGTCLRKVYGLPRLSEDLDFDYITSFDIDEFAKNIESYFVSKLLYKNIVLKVATHKRTVFLKFPTLLSDLELVKNRSESALLFVRCDFSEERLGEFKTEINSISTSNYTMFIKNYDLSTLFANKIHAFLTRNYFKGKDQQISFKGRDVFDIVWFIQKSKKDDFQLKPNWNRTRLEFPGQSEAEIVKAVVEKSQKIDPKKVYLDLAPFVESSQSVENFCGNYAKIIGTDFEKLI